ncbi:MAG: hypothetical protein GC164_15555 [Phycisphaera sp.]|nr:hypothetical protein [Phycisphaera sp.]
MARPSTTGLELSFHKPSKRWKKVIDGKTFYFGSGKNAGDTASYNRARRKYRAYMDDLAAQQEDRANTVALRNRLYRLAKEQAASHDPDGHLDQLKGKQLWDEIAEAQQAGTLEDLLLGRSPIEYVLGAKPLQKPRRVAPQIAKGSIAATVVEYLEDQKRRVEVSASSTGHSKRALGDRGYKGMQNGMSTFKAFAGQEDWGDAQHTETILDGYRRYLEQKLGAEEYSAHTFNDKLKHLKPFIKWAYSKRKIVEQPRNMDEIGSKVPVARSGKPLSLEVVKKLWSLADNRMRCWIALGLNCGYYSKDISDLKPKDLEVAPGYIAKRREKTDVPSKHKLWKITADLIHAALDDVNRDNRERLFVTAMGTPLNTADRDRIGTFFSKLAKRAKVKAVFSQLRDTGAQFIEEIGKSSSPIDLALTDLYLSHRDSRTASYYVSNDPALIPTASLDRALDEMEKKFKPILLPTAPEQAQAATKPGV